MEFVALNVDGVHLGVGDFDARRIAVGIDLALHLQAGLGRGGGNQLDDGLVADEGPTAPVLGDERKEAMLDLVPFAGAGRKVADRDDDAELCIGLDMIGQVSDLGVRLRASDGSDQQAAGMAWLC